MSVKVKTKLIIIKKRIDQIKIEEKRIRKMSSFKNIIKKLDAYGAPVGLNYNGEKKFKTVPGAIVTIMTKLFLIWSIAIKLIRL